MSTRSALGCAGLTALLVSACAEPTVTPSPSSEPELLVLPVTRDTWFSGYEDEALGNLGGSHRLKLKSYQELALLDFDPTPLQGRVVVSAKLVLQVAGDTGLDRVSVSSFASEWVEGTSGGYDPQEGSSCFAYQRYPGIPWAGPGSDVSAVCLGSSGTVWSSAPARPRESGGWVEIDVHTRVFDARVAGMSHGFVVFDDTGSEWTREGDALARFPFPNRYVYSRDAGAERAPRFEVIVSERDDQPPGVPEDLQLLDDVPLPAGEARVSWRTPIDPGPGGMAGFEVLLDGKSLPRYLVPHPAGPGVPVELHLRDLDLAPGQEVSLAVRALDSVGNRGPAAMKIVRVSDTAPVELPSPAKALEGEAKPLRIAGVQVAILDALDRVSPKDGRLSPTHDPAYLQANHLFRAQPAAVQLEGARGETLAFQLALIGSFDRARATLGFPGEAGARPIVTTLEPRAVSTERGPLPDPVVPSNGRLRGKGVAAGSLLFEVHLPKDLESGRHDGALTITVDGESLEVPLRLIVWDVALPDVLGFLPELNAYQLPDATEREYYRVAHAHRSVVNRLQYWQSGDLQPGGAPELTAGGLDWEAWDARFGPLFDGSLFADLPRGPVPVEVFYLPLHENWPSPMEGNYGGGYWADEAFPDAYRNAFVDTSRAFAEHFDARGWHRTMFQCLLNNKIDFKEKGWSRGSSVWLLDEPAHFQDFEALRYFGEAFHEGVQGFARGAQLAFRADISRPQWQRDGLDDVLDCLVVNGAAFREQRRVVLDRKRRLGQVVVDYGTASRIEDSAQNEVAWCLDSWSLGSDGVLPWQTIGTAQSWKQADRLALLYPGAPGGQQGVVPSLRLKALRRGQQDVELLRLWAAAHGHPRWAVGDAVREYLGLDAEATGTDPAAREDAGALQYSGLTPQQLAGLRLAIGRDLSGRVLPEDTRARPFELTQRESESGR